MEVVAFELLGGTRVRVAFADRFEREVDLEPFLTGPIFEPLREPRAFAEVFLDEETGTLAWPNGADIAPEALRAGRPLDDRPPARAGA